MKRPILYAVAQVLIASFAYAAKSTLTVDERGIRVPFFAPDAKKQQSFSANRTAKDMRDDIAFAIQNPQSSCKFRLQSTATRVGSFRYLPKGANYQRGVNPSTPYLNTSTCANGTGEYQ